VWRDAANGFTSEPHADVNTQADRRLRISKVVVLEPDWNDDLSKVGEEAIPEPAIEGRCESPGGTSRAVPEAIEVLLGLLPREDVGPPGERLSSLNSSKLFQDTISPAVVVMGFQTMASVARRAENLARPGDMPVGRQAVPR
jgi:hypothetical protein